MASYKFTIDKVWVPNGGGQGLFEGPMEVKVTARMTSNGQELVKTVPGGTAYYVLKPGGAQQIVTQPIGEVTDPPPGGQMVNVEAFEIDGGLNGQDDYGSGSLTFKLTPGMAPTTQVVNMPLYRPKMSKPLGSVSVQILAQQI